MSIHKVLATINGVKPAGDWVEEGHQSHIDICIEIYDGAHMAYVGGLNENGVSVRVDLDGDGWRRLAAAATDVAERMEASHEQ